MKRIALVFFVLLAAMAVIYRRAPVQFLRAESGWYLAQSHADDATKSAVVRSFFTTSYGGHYAPLAFLAEFETAKFAGPSRTFWRWRQFVAVALTGTAIFFAARAIATALGVGSRDLLAAAFASVAIFQPAMLDLVSWPFMVMQLAWCGLSLLAIYAVAQLPTEPRRWTLIALAAAYASLHFSGVGIVTLAGTTAALLVLRAPLRNRAVATLGVLAALHLAMMILLLPPSHSRFGLPLISCTRLLLGFIPQFAFSGLRGAIGLAADEPSPFAMQYGWAIGLAIVVVLVTAIVRGRAVRSLAAALTCGSAVSFLVMIAMIGARMFEESSVHAIATNLAFIVHAPRYLVPLHIVFLPAIACATAALMRKSPRLVASVCALAIVAMPLTQLSFQRTAYLVLDPAARVSHYSVWRLIVTTARQCRAAGLPLPNVPLDAVTREFADWDPRMFRTLLSASEQAALIDWRDYLGRDREPYAAKVPALRALEQRLGVEEK